MSKFAEDVQSEEFAQAISLIVRRVRAKAPAEVRDFSWTQKSILMRLEKDGPATSADLARAEGVTPQSMGTAIAGLEALELVRRQPHPTDGRQMVLSLTEKGHGLRLDLKDAKRSWLSNALSELDDGERKILGQAVQIMLKMADRP